jgi:hypothetical protein
MKRRKAAANSVAEAAARKIMAPPDCAAAGKALRDKFPRERHGDWKESKGRGNLLNLLHKSDVGRMKELIPIRYGRMLGSPFAFYRGAASVPREIPSSHFCPQGFSDRELRLETYRRCELFVRRSKNRAPMPELGQNRLCCSALLCLLPPSADMSTREDMCT